MQTATAPLCKRCGDWEVIPGDRFCSGCAAPFTYFELDPPSFSFHAGAAPPSEWVTIRNTSNTNISIASLQPSAAWVEIEESPRLPFLLAPGAKAEFAFAVNTIGHSEDTFDGGIQVTSDLGVVTLQIQAGPEPELVFDRAHKFDLYPGQPANELPSIPIRIAKGAIKIEGLAVDPPVATPRLPSGGNELLLNAEAATEAVIHLVPTDAFWKKVAGASKFPVIEKARLLLHPSDPKRAIEFEFQGRRPPQLRGIIEPWHDSVLEITAGAPAPMKLFLENSSITHPQLAEGNAPLKISNIEVVDAQGNRVPWIQTPPVPENMEGGAAANLQFHVFPPPLAQGGAPQEHLIQLRIFSNLGAPKRIDKHIRITAPRPFPGWLAIDFGSSNSCCGVITPHFRGASGKGAGKPLVLPVDSPAFNADPQNIPSALRYLDLTSAGERKYEIGEEALARVTLIDDWNSLQRDIKRSLRNNEPRKIKFANSGQIRNLTPSQLLVDYLREIRARAEAAGASGRHFERIIFTHPTRFGVGPLQLLDAAMREVFGEHVELRRLQEPVAAALHFIVDYARSKTAVAADRYTLAVFDFGGGTTDLALLDVTVEGTDGDLSITPCLRGCSGQWFGGENITDFVFDFIVDRINLLAAPQEMEVYVDPKSRPEARFTVAAGNNRQAIRKLAEAVKIHLASHERFEEFQAGLSDRLRLDVREAGRWREFEPHLAEIVPTQADLYTFLRPKLQGLAKLLRELVRNANLDEPSFVLLSGASCRFAIVRDVLKAAFPNSAIEEPRDLADLKRGVVKGACLRCLVDAPGDLQLVLPEHQTLLTTPARIGLGLTYFGEPVFVELIELGRQIPEEGLEGTSSKILRVNPKTEFHLFENLSMVDSLDNNPDAAHLGDYIVEAWPEALRAKSEVRAKPVIRLSTDFSIRLFAACVETGTIIPFIKRT